MKLLITTRADEKISEMTDITHPILKAYADEVGADFRILSDDNDFQHPDPQEYLNGKHAYRIFEQYDLFDQYDRILQIDSDILLSPQCPNIFDLVPYDSIGTVFEDKGSRRGARHGCIQQAQAEFGDIGWREGYINTGFFLTSKCHRNIFKKIEGRYFGGFGKDDVHIAYLMNKHKHKVCELPFQWNHMTMFSEGWNGSPDRFHSHVIHYAGQGIFEGPGPRINQIKRDKAVWYG